MGKVDKRNYLAFLTSRNKPIKSNVVCDVCGDDLSEEANSFQEMIVCGECLELLENPILKIKKGE